MPPSADELIYSRMLSVAYIPLQLTKILSIVNLHNLNRLLVALLIPGAKAAQARLYPGIIWPGTIYTP